MISFYFIFKKVSSKQNIKTWHHSFPIHSTTLPHSKHNLNIQSINPWLWMMKMTWRNPKNTFNSQISPWKGEMWNYLKGMCEATRLSEAVNEIFELKFGDFSAFFHPLLQNRTHWNHWIPNLKHAIFETRHHAFRRVHAHFERPTNANTTHFHKFAFWSD